MSIPVIMLLVLSLSSTTPLEEGLETYAGITPDSFAYPLDRLAEDISIIEADRNLNVMLDILDEKIAETEEMLLEEKLDDAEKSLVTYFSLLDGIVASVDTSSEDKAIVAWHLRRQRDFLNSSAANSHNSMEDLIREIESIASSLQAPVGRSGPDGKVIIVSKE